MGCSRLAPGAAHAVRHASTLPSSLVFPALPAHLPIPPSLLPLLLVGELVHTPSPPTSWLAWGLCAEPRRPAGGWLACVIGLHGIVGRQVSPTVVESHVPLIAVLCARTLLAPILC